jgi:lipoyl(octanoyl) transferase
MLPADQEKKKTSPDHTLADAVFRIIVDTPGNGGWNMAVDEALMECAGLPGAMPVIRFYHFNPPALSVGRFQKTDSIFDFQALKRDGLSFVRRPSGGQAVLHDQELTYSVAAGKHLFGRLSKRELYRFIVPILIAGLDSLGIAGSAADGGSGDANPDCFASTGEYEIKSNQGRKLIGSAQMVSRSAVLQHGSIPLGRANRRIHAYILGALSENSSSSLSEESKNPLSVQDATKAFVEAAANIIKIEISTHTPGELSRAEELLAERYETSEWNQKY